MACKVPCRSVPVIRRPPWADPRYIGATNQTRFTLKTFAAGNLTTIAPNNPKRWGLGFTGSNLTVGASLVAPHNQPGEFGLEVPRGPAILWFDLHEFGPMVSYEWYILPQAGERIILYETEIL